MVRDDAPSSEECRANAARLLREAELDTDLVHKAATIKLAKAWLMLSYPFEEE